MKTQIRCDRCKRTYYEDDDKIDSLKELICPVCEADSDLYPL
jgi:hypothetical protein